MTNITKFATRLVAEVKVDPVFRGEGPIRVFFAIRKDREAKSYDVVGVAKHADEGEPAHEDFCSAGSVEHKVYSSFGEAMTACRRALDAAEAVS